jgi:hypothetical protein
MALLRVRESSAAARAAAGEPVPPHRTSLATAAARR